MQAPCAPDKVAAAMLDLSWRRSGLTINEWGQRLSDWLGSRRSLSNSNLRAMKAGIAPIPFPVMWAAVHVAGATLDELLDLALRELDVEASSPLAELREQLRQQQEESRTNISQLAGQTEEIIGRLITLEEVVHVARSNSGRWSG